MKAKWQKFSNIMSWVIMFAMVGLLVFSVKNTIEARRTGESVFLFGHRPILVLTGSMEPYMMTNGLALTREVTDIDQLEVGDVVTYHTETSSGRLIRITHRIISIDNGVIQTKGDNNRVSDGYTLTIDNIESEVVAVFNQTAWIADKWGTTTGKIMIISFSAAIILLYICLKSSLTGRKKDIVEDAEGEETSSAEPKIESAGVSETEAADPAATHKQE